MTKSNNKSPNGKIGFYHMLRDIMVTSMNKGQFPLAIVGLVVIILILKMPAADVSKFVFEILGSFKSLHLVGWFLTLSLSIGWFLHSKRQRRALHNEIARVAGERNIAQEKLLGTTLPSSNKH